MATGGGGGWSAPGTGIKYKFVSLALGLLCCGLSLLFGVPAVGARPSVDEIVANVRSAVANQPTRYSFRQDIELRVLILRWRFHADVRRDGDRIDVQVHDAPGFLSPDIAATLLEVSEGLDGFTLKLVAKTERGGDVYYVVEGVSTLQEGARSGTIWVNARTWLIDEAVLKYDWGNLTVQQRFQTINGYTLLREQHAAVDRLGGKLRVQYGGYSFDEH